MLLNKTTWSRAALIAALAAIASSPLGFAWGSRRDAPTDVAARQSGFNPFPGEWVSIPGAAPTCNARIARDPGRDVPALNFVTCPSGRSGCRHATARWTDEAGSTFLFRREPVRVVDGMPYLSYARLYPTSINLPSRANINVIETKGGQTVMAVGDYTNSATACGGHLVVGSSTVAAAFISAAAPDHQLIGTAPIGKPTSLSLRAIPIGALGSSAGGAVQRASHLGNQFYLGMSMPFGVTIWDFARKKAIVPQEPKRLPAELPVAVRDGTLALDNENGGIWFVSSTGSYLKLVAPAGPQIIFDLAVDRANGEQIVWLEGDRPSFDYTHVSLWTAPYATDPAHLHPRRVATLGDPRRAGGGVVANAGVVLTLQTKNSARLTRLSDGKSWLIAADPGQRFIQPLWVDDDEVWLSTGPDQPSSADYQTGIVRFSRGSVGSERAALGPGEDSLTKLFHAK